MGGIGKTTLAQYIYNLNRRNFKSRCFVEEIGRRFKQTYGLLEIQKQLLTTILGGNNNFNFDVSEGTTKIREALRKKKVLIVLDDIDEDEELSALFGTSAVHTQSKIIITTRRLDIDSWVDSISWRCDVHQLRLLSDHESLELFNYYAFGSKLPIDSFSDLAAKLVQYCGGNPLALKYMGCSLFVSANDQRDIHIIQQIWISRWNAIWLKGDLDYKVLCVLRKSLDSLPLADIDLFMHIAVFFVGEYEDHVVKILGDDLHLKAGIISLINNNLLTVSSNKKLVMHQLLQDMARSIVRNESKDPTKRTRVWHNEAYHVLAKGDGSGTIEGLALDSRKLQNGTEAIKTDSLAKMYKLKYLQLKYVELTGDYMNFPKLRWLCWHGCHLRTIPSGLWMSSSFLVAIDMSNGNLETFDPPIFLKSMRILNLSDSHSLLKVRNIVRLPNLETLILSCCHILDSISEMDSIFSHYPSLMKHTKLTQLDLTNCKSLHLDKPKNSLGVPFTLLSIERLNLGNNPIAVFPKNLLAIFSRHSRLKNHLRVLDLTMCSKLKSLPSLPRTLAELYINHCVSLDKVTFESHQFTLQEFECKGCTSLSEIEGIIKLEPVDKLEQGYLGHMKWLKEYQHHEVCLVGHNELTIGRSCRVQMLCEFGIKSTCLPDTKDPNMTQHISESSFLCFDVPPYPNNRRLEGLNVIFKYTMSTDNPLWFVKISTDKGVDLMYNPALFGKPESGEVGTWFSYWPIGSKLDTGDKVTVSIIVINGLEVIECGASLVYAYDLPNETLEHNMSCEETLGGDWSEFELSTGAYYLCRCDIFKSMEVDQLDTDWFRILVGDAVDKTELQEWKITGRAIEANSRITELN